MNMYATFMSNFITFFAQNIFSMKFCEGTPYTIFW